MEIMEDEGRGEGSSPLATVEQIQRRLVRPTTSLHSHSSTTIITPWDDVNSTEFQRIKREGAKREVTNKRLEDYLDPVLLSAIRRKIGGKSKRDGGLKLKREFEWPIDGLKVFAEDLRREKGMKWRSSVGGAVDLDEDRDLIGGGGEDDEEEQVSCTPFQRFERAALKRFKGVGEG
ncbi:uncharacterized protein LOC132285295 [Cornus florida]|uniref:uncharacterized protein LOC132285295 n=1 Tax=Cornus florida TaxID=4283 RepID=UPI0028A066A7|nr:uncharacterized protein LOC132285295 [Cornus florida]